MLVPARIRVRLVDPATLISGSVSIRATAGLAEVRIAENARVAHEALDLLKAAGEEVVAALASIAHPGRAPIVRYFLERDMPRGQLLVAETTHYQVDIRVRRGLIPQDIADEIAGHSTELLRYLLGDPDGAPHEAVQLPRRQR